MQRSKMQTKKMRRTEGKWLMKQIKLIKRKNMKGCRACGDVGKMR